MEAVVDPRDRGLAYGDGLFESLRVVDGRMPLLGRHLARLACGCARLAIPFPGDGVLGARLQSAAQARGNGMVKLIVTRGRGMRGYAPPHAAVPTIIVLDDALPPARTGGLVLHDCALRLAEQPLLAGIKHTNRLEQVLACAEWDDPAIDDGLMCDAAGRVVCTTRANVFAVIDGRLVTPAMLRCGVEGVARGCVLDALGDAVEVRDVRREELEQADEIIVTNALRGAQSVRRLGAREYVHGPWSVRLAAVLAAAGLPGAPSA
jgi:4-amino-4-deoxychorismate lyase